MSDSLRPHGLYNPWNSPGQNTGVGSLSLLQGIFLTQELNQGLLHCRQILYQLSYQGSLIDPLLSIKFCQCWYRIQNHAGKIGLVICFCRGQGLRRFQGKGAILLRSEQKGRLEAMAKEGSTMQSTAQYLLSSVWQRPFQTHSRHLTIPLSASLTTEFCPIDFFHCYCWGEQEEQRSIPLLESLFI